MTRPPLRERCPGSLQPGTLKGWSPRGYPTVLCSVCGHCITVQTSMHMGDLRAGPHKRRVGQENGVSVEDRA